MKHLFIVCLLALIVTASTVAIMKGKPSFAIVTLVLGLLTVIGYRYLQNFDKKILKQTTHK